MKIASFLLIFTFSISLATAQEIPAIHNNMGNDDKGIYVEYQGKKLYAKAPEDKFKFEDLYGNPSGDEKGLALDFKFPELNGTLYFGFINYGDADYPQTVFFKRTAEINKGKAYINIADNFSGKYDMIGWQETGLGTLGFRIVDDKGRFLYDGKASFHFNGSTFNYLPTLIEGPFVDLIKPNSAVISFETTEPIEAEVKIGDKTYPDQQSKTHHVLKIEGLAPDTKYEYTVKCGKLEFTYSFKTAPEPGSRNSFTFAYSSDSRAGQGGGERNIFGTNAYIVKKIAALAKSEDVAFLQFTGDLVNGYETSRERMQLQYANWKHAIEPFAHHFPVYESFGNHESYGYVFHDPESQRGFMIDHFPFGKDSGEEIFARNFVNPTNGPKSEDDSKYDPNPGEQDFPSYEENAFWYRYDNVAMISLNSDYWYAPSGSRHTGGNIHAYIMNNQKQWLKETLQLLEDDATIDHVFVTLHTPFFPNGGHVGDDMWYDGSNKPRPVVGNKSYENGIIQRRDQLLDLIVNQSKKPVALLTGDEHNYNLLPITNEMQRYPKDYPHKKLTLERDFYQINNGAAGAPYYAQEKTPWMEHVIGFSTQNALVLIDVDGESVKVRVKNPDTLEEIARYTLR
ncbi:MAG: metallophosphoesterase family protein [Bacteroidales bacterium]|nr:metallophosphoesterase family protein [Bacteroidales bacterium]